MTLEIQQDLPIKKRDINLYIEELKVKHEFDTYLETISYYYENESDQDMNVIARHLNKKIVEELYKEGISVGMVKDEEIISIL